MKSQIKANFKNIKTFPSPFLHYVGDNFLDEETVNELVSKLPLDTKQFHQLFYFSQKKYALNDLGKMPEAFASVFKHFVSNDFVEELEKITGISGLIADPNLHGAGIHVIKHGGFLKMHRDFETHYKKPGFKRVLSFIFYVNPNWEKENQSALVLLKGKDRKTIDPLLNRAVLFGNERDGYHGHPEPFLSNNIDTRTSIAAYYYTRKNTKASGKSTSYMPNDSKGSMLMLIENYLLKVRLFVLSLWTLFNK